MEGAHSLPIMLREDLQGQQEQLAPREVPEKLGQLNRQNQLPGQN
jgi:hypothetical protein